MLTKVSYAMIDGAPVNAVDYGVVGDGITNDTTAIQNMITANPGKTIVFYGLSLISTTITVAGNNTRLVFMPGAGFTYSTATLRALTVSGSGVQIENLNVVAPATFDATNVQPTYACLWVTGNNCFIDGLKITNVPKVGVLFEDCEGGSVINSTINGNFPSAGFTGTETGQVGILINAVGTGRQGDFSVLNCDITTCVQGVLVANYGPASRSQGILINANRFYSCWNHGVYAAGFCNGIGVTGNSFVFCQAPIAMTGAYHVVSSKTLTTGGSSGLYTDITGISMRDPTNCIVSDNVIQGEAQVGGIIINLTALSATVVRGNTVTGNTIAITGSGSSRAISVGDLTCTDLTDNIVSNNVCVSTGRNLEGQIAVISAPSAPAFGTIIANNSVVLRSPSYGVQLINTLGVSVSNNKIRLEYDAVGATTLGGVVLSSSIQAFVSGNTHTITSSWGANITYYGLWETGTASGNRSNENAINADPTKLASFTAYATVSGSGIIVHDTGAGAPNINAGVGSTWSRTDGGAGTSFYVKESGTAAAGWVGK